MNQSALETKQPKGLSLLFFTELWERFGFYVLMTILILYMTKGLHFSDVHADMLSGTLTAMMYLTPVIGGYLADRFLGFQRSIIFGGILLSAGYFMTAMPGTDWFFYGLAVIIVGNGYFKPNVSSIVGELYHENDPRRDGGFTIFYMGINLGSLLPPLFIGWVVHHYGWHLGFVSAAIGMVIALAIFMLGRHQLQGKGEYPAKVAHHPGGVGQRAGFSKLILILVGTLVAVYAFRLTFEVPALTNEILIAATIFIMGAVLFFVQKEDRIQRFKMIASLVLIVISVGFWAIYNQTFSSLMLFADRNMDFHWMGLTIDAEFTQFFNPFFIILLSPFLSRLWIRLSETRNPSIPTKFAIATLLIALGFFFIAISTDFANAAGQTSAWWLVGSYAIQTLGELFISPVGLAMITVLSPRHLVGMMMGVWFLSQSAAFALSGILATKAAIPEGLTAVQALPIYHHAFMYYGWVALGLTAVSFALVPVLRKLIETK